MEGQGLEDELSDCCIRCDAADGDATNGFFIACFERKAWVEEGRVGWSADAMQWDNKAFVADSVIVSGEKSLVSQKIQSSKKAADKKTVEKNTADKTKPEKADKKKASVAQMRPGTFVVDTAKITKLDAEKATLVQQRESINEILTSATDETIKATITEQLKAIRSKLDLIRRRLRIAAKGVELSADAPLKPSSAKPAVKTLKEAKRTRDCDATVETAQGSKKRKAASKK